MYLIEVEQTSLRHGGPVCLRRRVGIIKKFSTFGKVSVRPATSTEKVIADYWGWREIRKESVVYVSFCFMFWLCVPSVSFLPCLSSSFRSWGRKERSVMLQQSSGWIRRSIMHHGFSDILCNLPRCSGKFLIPSMVFFGIIWNVEVICRWNPHQVWSGHDWIGMPGETRRSQDWDADSFEYRLSAKDWTRHRTGRTTMDNTRKHRSEWMLDEQFKQSQP